MWPKIRTAAIVNFDFLSRMVYAMEMEMESKEGGSGGRRFCRMIFCGLSSAAAAE